MMNSKIAKKPYPQFTFKIPSPQELKVIIEEEEMKTGKFVNVRYFDKLINKLRDDAYKIYLEQRKKDLRNFRSLAGEFV